MYTYVYIWRRQWQPTPELLPGKSHGQRSLVATIHGVAKSRKQLSNFTPSLTPANAGDMRDTSLIPGSGRSPGGGHGNPLQYGCLENPMDRGDWQAAVHGVAKSWR